MFLKLLTFLTILFVQPVSSIDSPIFVLDVPVTEIDQIIGVVNNERGRLKLSKVRWNYDLEKSLNFFKSRNNPKWFFERTTKGYNSFNGFHLINTFNTTYFSKFVNYKPLIHDTCSNKKNAVLKIFKFRLFKQRKCFNYKVCSTTVYNKYRSCTTEPIVLRPKLPCSWFWQYYPLLMRRDLSDFACLLLGVPGPFTPFKQKNSFWCYGLYTIPVNDRPWWPAVADLLDLWSIYRDCEVFIEFVVVVKFFNY